MYWLGGNWRFFGLRAMDNCFHNDGAGDSCWRDTSNGSICKLEQRVNLKNKGLN